MLVTRPHTQWFETSPPLPDWFWSEASGLSQPDVLSLWDAYFLSIRYDLFLRSPLRSGFAEDLVDFDSSLHTVAINLVIAAEDRRNRTTAAKSRSEIRHFFFHPPALFGDWVSVLDELFLLYGEEHVRDEISILHEIGQVGFD